MGHSAGAQLAALVCTDDRYLKAEGVPLADVKGCVPVDGDTYDVPAIIETAEARWRAHGLPPAKFGHREKFGNDPAKHKDFSAVTHVAKGKGIPPFFVLHVAGHPDTTAQAQRLGNVLKDAGVPVTVFGAKETTHNKLNADLGQAGRPGHEGALRVPRQGTPEVSARPGGTRGVAGRPAPRVHSGDATRPPRPACRTMTPRPSIAAASWAPRRPRPCSQPRCPPGRAPGPRGATTGRR